jgi:hypothetical protein
VPAPWLSDLSTFDLGSGRSSPRSNLADGSDITECIMFDSPE